MMGVLLTGSSIEPVQDQFFFIRVGSFKELAIVELKRPLATLHELVLQSPYTVVYYSNIKHNSL